MKRASVGFRTLTTALELWKTGRLDDSVLDAMLSGVEFVTTSGVGTWAGDGMLDTASGKISLSLSKLTDIRVKAAPPAPPAPKPSTSFGSSAAKPAKDISKLL